MILIMVECAKEYWEFVRTLRMDTKVIEGFLQTQPITEEQQIKYMMDNSVHYRIALLDGKPAGYVGVIEDDIRVCTHPDFFGMGVGKFMIKSAMAIWPTACAKVKHSNIASNKLFLSCGFEVSGRDEHFVYYKFKKYEIV